MSIINARDSASVLVVEDDADYQFLTRAALESAGFHVEIAGNLHDALDLLSISEGVFDAIVLDLDLPDQEGCDTLELVQTVTAAPIVVFSAAPDRVRGRAGIEVQATVSKVDGPAALVPRLRNMIDEVPDGLREAPASLTDPAAPADFLSIAETVIEHLATSCQVSTWAVTRVVDDDWVILAVRDPNYGVQSGTVLRWQDTFCSRMVEGRPRVVADLRADGSYADVALGQHIEIGCYVGFPIIADGGDLFGTLCGIQPEQHHDPEALTAGSVLVESFAKILGSALSLDLQRSRMQRRLQIAELAARSDALTGLGNRRAWERTLRVEEARSARFGHHAGVAIIDLDGLKIVNDVHGHAAGDQLIKAAAETLTAAVRRVDQVFRIGGDEFAVLLPELGAEGLRALSTRISQHLCEAGIAAAIGVALRGSETTLTDAVETADARMYEQKRGRALTP